MTSSAQHISIANLTTKEVNVHFPLKGEDGSGDLRCVLSQKFLVAEATQELAVSQSVTKSVSQSDSQSDSQSVSQSVVIEKL